MDSITWPENKSRKFRRPAVALGVFDGVHRGHRSVLATTVQEARRSADEAVVLTFDRHPLSVVRGEAVPILNSLDYRLMLLGRSGVDCAAVLRFTPEMAAVAAESFVREFIWERLHAGCVVLGFDCRFGAGGSGNSDMLARMGAGLGFSVHTCPPVEVDGQIVSSTAIRAAVQIGDLAEARRMLGRPFSLAGTVVRGFRRGKSLQFPTANLDIHGVIRPPDGVYSGLAYPDGAEHGAVISIGSRPTFEGERPPRTRSRRLNPRLALSGSSLVEVHILDYGADLYGQELEVVFLDRIRPQRRYESAHALAEQIRSDVQYARQRTARR